MRTIVINALSALQGGGQIYLINLCRYFESSENTRVFIIIPKKYENLFSNSINSAAIKILSPEFPAKSMFHRLLWEKFRLPHLLNDLRADVLFNPGGSILAGNITDCKVAVAFQNMLPFARDERKRYPFGYMRARLWLLYIILVRSFKLADLTIFISHYAKDIIDQIIPRKKGLSVVIPHGVDERFRADDRRGAAPLPYEYVLYVSYIDVYKNQIEVIKAWKYLKEIRNTHERLVLIGPASARYLHRVEKIIGDYGLRNDIIYLGNVDYADLPQYYQFAKVNLFASTCENCPYIVLESMASGRPLFCSNHMPMPEIAADAALYFNPYKQRELADLLSRYLDDENTLREMGRAGYQRSLCFNSRKSAIETWNALLALTD